MHIYIQTMCSYAHAYKHKHNLCICRIFKKCGKILKKITEKTTVFCFNKINSIRIKLIIINNKFNIKLKKTKKWTLEIQAVLIPFCQTIQTYPTFSSQMCLTPCQHPSKMSTRPAQPFIHKVFSIHRTAHV